MSRSAPFRRRRRQSRLSPPLSPIFYVAPLAAFTAVFAWDGGPPGWALPRSAGQAASADRQFARFSSCSAGRRQSCVIDGDTFWYRGEKVRIADINTPETSEPGCSAEARLGAAATRRMAELLNAGAFSLEPVERSHDRYGRRLAIVTRGGASLGEVLVAEGLAEPWRGRRRDWC